jgi:hypothetical protein
MSNSRAALLALSFIVLAMGGAALAQKPQEQVFKDKQGRLKLWNMDSHEIRVQDKGPIKFEGEGRPIKGVSQDQGITLECLNLKADLETLKSKGYVLRMADLVGSVVLVQAKAGSTKTFKGGEAKIDDDGVKAQVTFTKPFTMADLAKEGGADAVRNLSANAGSVTLDTFRSQGGKLRSAEAAGSVEFSLKETGRDLLLKTAKTGITQGEGFLSFSLPTAFALNGSTQPKAGESNLVKASADSGTAKVADKVKKGENSLISLNLNGSVDLEVTSTFKTEKGEKVRIVKAKAVTLTFDRATGLMTLGGGVNYSIDSKEPGEEPVEAEGSSDVLTITFDSTGKVINASAKAGKTNLREGGKP